MIRKIKVDLVQPLFNQRKCYAIYFHNKNNAK